MRYDIRNWKTRHATRMLDELPVAGAPVTEARSSLEKAMSALTTASIEAHARKEAAVAASARVRDATAKAFDECRRSRAALLAKDVGLGETLSPHMRTKTVKSLLGRAEFLLELGTEVGVGLGALAAAREQRKLARRARTDLEGAWDAAYVALRAAVEGALAGRGTHGRELQAALHVYFPAQVVSEPQDGPAGDPVAKAPEEKKPAA